MKRWKKDKKWKNKMKTNENGKHEKWKIKIKKKHKI